MSRVLIDYQYAQQLASRLDKFKQIRDRLWNCRCPMCGDSKDKKKKRFYVYQPSKGGVRDHLSVSCHNCGYHNSFGRFLEEYDAGLYAEYRMDLFKEMGWGSNRKVEPDPPTVAENHEEEAEEDGETKPRQLTIPTIAELPEGHFAKDYVIGRMLPLWTHDYLHYSNDFKKHFEPFSEIVDEVTLKLPSDPRLVIPFYDEWNNLVAVQGRALGDSKLRYITLKKKESTVKTFGLDRLDKSRKILVVEGPIDSLFLPNCIATADADLTGVGMGDIFIFDNQFRNSQICDRIEQAIDKGKTVMLFPRGFPHKDINDAVKNGGYTPSDLVKLIGQRCFRGLGAKMELTQLRKDVKRTPYVKKSNS